MSDLLEKAKPHTFKEFSIFKGVIEWILQGNKQRYCVLGKDHWKSFYSTMNDLLGDSINAVLKKIGEDFGRKIFLIVEDQHNADRKTTFLFILQMLEKLGWGAFWNIKIDEDSKEINVELHNSNEAHVEGTPSCYHVNGILRGIAGGVLGDDIIVRETECIAKGDKICKFIIGTEVVVPDLYDKETLEELAKIIEELKRTIKSSIELVARTDGDPILTSELPEGIDSTAWGIIVSYLLAGGRVGSAAVKNGNLKEIIVNGEQGIIIATQCTKDVLIAAVIGPDTSPGLAGLAIKKAKEKIINLLK